MNAPNLMKKFGTETFYRIYLQELTRLVDTGYFQIIGHFDLPKKYGVQLPESLYPEVVEILQKIKRSGMTVEINTSGLRKPINEQYPADWILKELIKMEIPISLGSDAHAPKEVGCDFEKYLSGRKNSG